MGAILSHKLDLGSLSWFPSLGPRWVSKVFSSLASTASGSHANTLADVAVSMLLIFCHFCCCWT